MVYRASVEDLRKKDSLMDERHLSCSLVLTCLPEKRLLGDAEIKVNQEAEVRAGLYHKRRAGGQDGTPLTALQDHVGTQSASCPCPFTYVIII